GTKLPAITGFRVLAKKNPLSDDVLEAFASFGPTVREIIGNDSNDYVVLLDDKPLPVYMWSWVRPLPEQTLFIVPIPKDDGVRQLLLTAGLIAAAVFAAPALPAFMGMGTSAATAFWSGAIMAGGSLIMQALIKPPSIEPEATPKSLSNISSIRNRFAPYEPVPIVFGRRKVYPPYAAQPFTEIVGDDQYYNALFALGIGEYDIEEAKIGDTLLTNYQGVQLTKTTNP